MKLVHIQTCQPHRGHIDVCHTYDVYNLIEFKRRINAMRTVKEEEKHTDTHTQTYIFPSNRDIVASTSSLTKCMKTPIFQFSLRQSIQKLAYFLD